MPSQCTQLSYNLQIKAGLYIISTRLVNAHSFPTSMCIPRVLNLLLPGRELGLCGIGLWGTAGCGANREAGRRVLNLPKLDRELRPLLVPLVSGEYTWREIRFCCGLVTTSSSPC